MTAAGKIWTAYDVNGVREMAEEEPFGAAVRCQAEFQVLEKGYHRRLYELLGLIARISRQLLANRKDWKAFLTHSFWESRKRKPRPKKDLEKATQLLVEFVMKATDRSTRQRAWKHARVIEYFSVRGVDPDQYVEVIENDGGLEKVVALARAADPRRQQKPVFDIEEVIAELRADVVETDNQTRTSDPRKTGITVVRAECSTKHLKRLRALKTTDRPKAIVQRLKGPGLRIKLRLPKANPKPKERS